MAATTLDKQFLADNVLPRSYFFSELSNCRKPDFDVIVASMVQHTVQQQQQQQQLLFFS